MNVVHLNQDRFPEAHPGWSNLLLRLRGALGQARPFRHFLRSGYPHYSLPEARGIFRRCDCNHRHCVLISNLFRSFGISAPGKRVLLCSGLSMALNSGIPPWPFNWRGS